MTSRVRAASVPQAFALLVLSCVLALSRPAAAAGDLAEHGTVETVTSRWDGDSIVTDLVVRTGDGTHLTIIEHGGTVDGIGMSFSHRDADLNAGDEVAIVADSTGLRARRLSKRLGVTARLAEDDDIGSRHGVQRTTRSLKPLYHPTGCLEFQYDARGSAKVEGEWAAVDAAFAAWEAASKPSECGGLNFNRTLVANPPDGHDGVNTIRFRDDTWCRPASDTSAPVCHSPDAVAVTRTIFIDDPLSPRDGEILEVDIEINAVNFQLAVDGRANAIDLTSAAAHEIGHALGLDHNCGVAGGSWPVDETGALVPECESVPPELANATMYFQVPPGVTTMRTPEASDVEGLCSVVQARCTGELSGGCSVAGPTADGDTSRSIPRALPVAFLVLGLVLRRRRRRA